MSLAICLEELFLKILFALQSCGDFFIFFLRNQPVWSWIFGHPSSPSLRRSWREFACRTAPTASSTYRSKCATKLDTPAYLAAPQPHSPRLHTHSPLRQQYHQEAQHRRHDSRRRKSDRRRPPSKSHHSTAWPLATQPRWHTSTAAFRRADVGYHQ